MDGQKSLEPSMEIVRDEMWRDKREEKRGEERGTLLASL
jgi:hypothetical protein